MGGWEEELEDVLLAASRRHHPLLIKLICDELGVEAGQICDIEMQLTDSQAPALGGAAKVRAALLSICPGGVSRRDRGRVSRLKFAPRGLTICSINIFVGGGRDLVAAGVYLLWSPR